MSEVICDKRIAASEREGLQDGSNTGYDAFV